MSDSSLLDILLGRHGYSESPEIETGWCRVCLLLGFIFGVFACIAVPELLRALLCR